jgi:ribosome-binding ATPase YchF (GTP1/OBG family)
MEKKITKFDMFTDLKAIVAASVEIDEELKIAYEEMLDKELASLEKRKESAQKRAAAKKEESDALTDEILAVVKNAADVILVDDIVEALDNEEVTRQKVTARLGKLVNAGAITKETVKVEGARKMGYRAAE